MQSTQGKAPAGNGCSPPAADISEEPEYIFWPQGSARLWGYKLIHMTRRWSSANRQAFVEESVDAGQKFVVSI